MYRIEKNGVFVSNEDKLRYTKHQSNGIDVLCSPEVADGLVINNDYIEALDGVTIVEFDGAQRLTEMEDALNELGVVTRDGE